MIDQAAGFDAGDRSHASERAPSSVATADRIYRGPEAEAAKTARPEAPPAEEQAPVAYEPFAVPQGVEVDTAAPEKAQSLLLRTQGDFQAEINAHADGRSPPLLEPRWCRAEALRPSGVKWVEAFNGFVRPFLTLCFFVLYAAVKAAQFVILQQDHSGSAATLVSMWGEEDWAVWAAVVTFWFGGRTFNKERGRG